MNILNYYAMLQLQNITYQIGERKLLDTINWTITPGKRIGLIGPNGAGKTTLLRIIIKELQANSGTIIKPGEFKKAFDLLKQGKPINYEGAAGAVDFDKNGDVVTPIEVWKYDSKGEIVTVRVEYEVK